jgi:hypothetical protein
MAKEIKNTLQVSLDTWSDPGDYPNSLASGPLASYRYVDSIDGELVFELTDEEIQDYEDSEEDFVETLDLPTWDEVYGVTWHHDLANNTLTFTVADVESKQF